MRGGECYINGKTFVFYQVMDWWARSFDDFFGNTNISSSALLLKQPEGSSGRNQPQQQKNDLSSVPESSKTKVLPRKRAKSSSVDVPCHKSRQNWSQTQDEPWVDRYRPETQVRELF